MLDLPNDPAILTMPTTPTWENLAGREPRLAALLAEARAVRGNRGPDFDPLAEFFGYAGGFGFKRQIFSLVGWYRRDNDALLGSSAAYVAVYEMILDTLEGD